MSRWDEDRLEAERLQWEEDRGIEEYESGLAWQARFDRQQAEQQEQTWDGHHDRRLFAVDGELVEQARRDLEHIDLPGNVA